MIGTIKNNSREYPELLKEIGDAPKQLFYRGEWNPELFEKCLAVVGTRRMTSYGRRVCEQIVGEVASAGITIVSGFMYGIDAAAHQAAIRAGGKTIAVMPCGIDLIHPEYQASLHQEIIDTGGLVLSEYEGTYPSATWMFPRRNRIVAGLSQATLVIEAGEGSGALITAHFAKKYGRRVFAVPNPITSAVSQGVTQLLREGARAVANAQDILTYYGIMKLKTAGSRRDAADGFEEQSLEKRIIRQLQKESLEIDELARVLSVPVSDLGSTLSMLQMEGYIFEEAGKLYVN